MPDSLSPGSQYLAGWAKGVKYAIAINKSYADRSKKKHRQPIDDATHMLEDVLRQMGVNRAV